MSSRSLPPASAPPSQTDLESTAELPVLDPAAASDAGATLAIRPPQIQEDEHHVATDSWAPSPANRAALSAAAAGAEQRLQHEAELQKRTAALQEAQERLASHGQRLLQLERARDEALAAQAAAAQRAASAEQRVASAEQRVASAEQRAAAAEQRAIAAEERATAAEQRGASSSAEIAARRAAATQHETRLEESARALAAAERSAAGPSEELIRARALLTAAEARAQQLQERLAELDSDTRARAGRELEQQQAQLAEGQAHSLAVMVDLHNERARAMSYLEALQTLEHRRELAQHVLTELQQEAESRTLEMARLARELSLRDERLAAHETELAQRAVRITQLEQRTSTLTTMLAQRDTELRAGQQEAQGLRASLGRLQAEINAGAERVRTLEAQVARRSEGDAEQQRELERLRSEERTLAAALEEARRAAANAAAHNAAQQAEIVRQRDRGAELEAALEAERQRAVQLESELGTVRSEMEEWGGVLRSAQQERSAHLARVAAAESRVRELEQNALADAENVRALQAEAATHVARIRELESDLHAAEESLHRLEAETRSRGTRVAELEKSNQQWREAASEARHAGTDSNTLLGEAARPVRDDAPGSEPVPDAATRLLIQSADGREVVHVLGRKTSIGRTPDNDLQLEAKFVSRHHAVILVGPVNTIIEDLNSTNGVQVNGRRVTRQTLRDGDQIAIGRAQYRFAVRKPADKR